MGNEYESTAGAGAVNWADWAWQNKRQLLGLYYVLAALALLALMLMPRSFQSTAIISIQPTDRAGVPLSVEQAARSQIAILQSEEVIRRAIDKVGVDKLISVSSDDKAAPQTRSGVFFRGLMRSLRGGSNRLSPADAAFIAVSDALDARVGANTNLIHLVYKNSNPEVAKSFTKAWVESFVARYYELYSNGNSVSFFRDQQARSIDTFKEASARLSDYASRNNAFEVGEQRRLLLQERNALATALVTTQGSIQQVTKQIEVIPTQLDKMKLFGGLPQVKALAQSPTKSAKAPEIGDEALKTRLASDPPLLLVRVYQDTIATLIKLNTDLAGLRALAESQSDNMRKLDEQLGGLSLKEAEYQRLLLDVNQARASVELHSKRAVDEQLSHDLDVNMLSSVRVVQSATAPLTSSWPNFKIIFSLALMLGALPLFVAAGRYLLHRTEGAQMVSQLWPRRFLVGS